MYSGKSQVIQALLSWVVITPLISIAAHAQQGIQEKSETELVKAISELAPVAKSNRGVGKVKAQDELDIRADVKSLPDDELYALVRQARRYSSVRQKSNFHSAISPKEAVVNAMYQRRLNAEKLYRLTRYCNALDLATQSVETQKSCRTAKGPARAAERYKMDSDPATPRKLKESRVFDEGRLFRDLEPLTPITAEREDEARKLLRVFFERSFERLAEEMAAIEALRDLLGSEIELKHEKSIEESATASLRATKALRSANGIPPLSESDELIAGELFLELFKVRPTYRTSDDEEAQRAKQRLSEMGISSFRSAGSIAMSIDVTIAYWKGEYSSHRNIQFHPRFYPIVERVLESEGCKVHRSAPDPKRVVDRLAKNYNYAEPVNSYGRLVHAVCGGSDVFIRYWDARLAKKAYLSFPPDYVIEEDYSPGFLKVSYGVTETGKHEDRLRWWYNLVFVDAHFVYDGKNSSPLTSRVVMDAIGRQFASMQYNMMDTAR